MNVFAAVVRPGRTGEEEAWGAEFLEGVKEAGFQDGEEMVVMRIFWFECEKGIAYLDVESCEGMPKFLQHGVEACGRGTVRKTDAISLTDESQAR